MEDHVLTNEIGGHMAILDTFTTVGPMSVCYPRLNSTVPLDSVQVDNPSTGLYNERLNLVNKVEGLGLSSGMSLLLPEKSESVLGF
jgi:hypothetical protein